MEKKKYWPLTLAAFGGGCLLMAAVYFCLGWWPFGTGTVLTGDLRGLYVNYITDMWARVKQGGFFYSFGKLAGGSTLGLFAYYMNSPFNLLFLLLPTRMVPQAAGLIFLLRTGVTAAAFCWYLQRHFAKADPLVAVLGQCDACCAVCSVYNQNIIWMDVVWLLPLVLAALDDLMRQGRHWGFTVLVFLCILLNFYIAWPVCLFSILYFLCLWPRRGQGRFGRRFAAFAASGVLAAGLSFFFLLPVLLEVQESKGGLFDFTFSLTPQFNLLQLPYRLFFGNFFWNDVTNGLPNIYCGVVLVPLVLLYFCGNAPRREKLGFAALLAALAGSFWVKGVDQIWHGMKQPVWFPYRYSFLFSAVVFLRAARVLTAGPQRRRAWGLAAGLTLVWLAGYPLAAGAELFSKTKLIAAAGLCMLSLILAWLLIEKPALPVNKRRLLCGTAALLTAADLGANTVLALRKFEQFDLAAHFMGENTKANGATPAFRHSIFGGIAYCACCGAAMCSGGSVYNGERAKYWYLVCNNLSSRAQTRCLRGARIRYDDLMEVVRCDLNKLLAFGEDEIRTITENAVEQANASLGGEEPAVQIENIDKQTARLKKMIERSYRDNIAGMLSDDIHEEMVKKFGIEIDELTVRRKKLVAGETTAKEIRSAYGLFFDLAKRYTCVETLDRDILHTFVERIEIGEKILPEGRKVAGPRTPYRQSIRIFYRFIGEASGDSLRQVQANRDREETVGAAGAF